MKVYLETKPCRPTTTIRRACKGCLCSLWKPTASTACWSAKHGLRGCVLVRRSGNNGCCCRIYSRLLLLLLFNVLEAEMEAARSLYALWHAATSMVGCSCLTMSMTIQFPIEQYFDFPCRTFPKQLQYLLRWMCFKLRWTTTTSSHRQAMLLITNLPWQNFVQNDVGILSIFALLSVRVLAGMRDWLWCKRHIYHVQRIYTYDPLST